MRKLILSFVVMLLPLMSQADAIEILGIYYNLISVNGTNIAEVANNPQRYSGNITIPESITYNDVTYQVTSIGKSAFTDCHQVVSVKLPSTLKSIGDNAFQACSNLKYLDLPNGLTTIGERAFWFCGIVSIELPSSLVSIGKEAFLQCTQLTVVRSRMENPIDIYEYEFMKDLEGTYNNPTNQKYVETLYVPQGLKEVYQVKTGWKNFGKIKETNPNHIAFADDKLRHYCVKAGINENGVPYHYSRDADFDKLVTKWDTDGDEELSYEEAAAITDIGTVFGYQLTRYFNNTEDRYNLSFPFNELQYFTGLTNIPQNAFSYFISSIIIPKNIITIEENSVVGLSDIAVDVENAYFVVNDNVLYSKDMTQIIQALSDRIIGSFSIPNTVNTIKNGAFKACHQMTSVTMPKTISTIGSKAFSNCI